MNAPTKIVPIGNRLRFVSMERNCTRIQKTVFSAELEIVTMLDAIVMAAAEKIYLIHLPKRRDYLSWDMAEEFCINKFIFRL